MNFGRNSVYMFSDYQIQPGNLLLFDAVHLPFGVSCLFLPLIIYFTEFIMIYSFSSVLCLARVLVARTGMAG